MLLSSKTHCFQCHGDRVIRSTVYKPDGWTYATYTCPDCESHSTVLLAIAGDTGKNNRALRDAGIGVIEYFPCYKNYN